MVDNEKHRTKEFQLCMTTVGTAPPQWMLIICWQSVLNLCSQGHFVSSLACEIIKIHVDGWMITASEVGLARAPRLAV